MHTGVKTAWVFFWSVFDKKPKQNKKQIQGNRQLIKPRDTITIEFFIINREAI